MVVWFTYSVMNNVIVVCCVYLHLTIFSCIQTSTCIVWRSGIYDLPEVGYCLIGDNKLELIVFGSLYNSC